MHNKVRTVVALAGVGFAVTLLFMQLGFLASVSLLALLVYDALDFDLVLTAPDYVMLTQSGTISLRRLAQCGPMPTSNRSGPCTSIGSPGATRKRRKTVPWWCWGSIRPTR